MAIQIRPNPTSLLSALTEEFYAKESTKEEVLSAELDDCVRLLKKNSNYREGEYKGAVKRIPFDILALAAKIEACEPRKRCKSGACPHCADAAQRLLTRATKNYLRAKHKLGVCVVTVIPIDGGAGPGQLELGDHERFVRRFKDKFSRACGAMFVGGVDWSFNEHSAEAFPPHWQRHLHGLAIGLGAGDLKVELKKTFAKTEQVSRPIRVEIWDGRAAALRYPFKRKFDRRIGTESGTRHDKSTGKSRTCRDVDRQPLKVGEKVELLIHLDEIGLGGRLFLKNLQFTMLSGVGPTFIQRPRKIPTSKRT